MSQTVAGLFRESGQADLAAARLREEYALTGEEDLDVIGPAEWEELGRPEPRGGLATWLLAFTGVGLEEPMAEADVLNKRWGDLLMDEETLVVARTGDREMAEEISHTMYEAGARRVDILDL